jgi:hypothetical protein
MNEEEIYKFISQEIKDDEKKEGLWTKAFSEAEGDGNKTKALYIKYRFDQINVEETNDVGEYKNIEEQNENIKTQEERRKEPIEYSSALKNDELENSIQQRKKNKLILNKVKNQRNNNVNPVSEAKNSKIKFGGLLLLFAFIFPIGIILGPLATLIELGKLTEMTSSSNVKVKEVVSTYNNRMILFQCIWFLWTFILLIPFFNKKEYFPIAYISSIVINFVISFSIILLLATDLSYINNNIIISDIILGSYSDPKIVFVILIQLLWILYFLFSSRVKNTFNQQ